MKLVIKIILCISIVFSVSLILSGILLITGPFHNMIQRETSQAVERFQSSRFHVISRMVQNRDIDFLDLIHEIQSEEHLILGDVIFLDADGIEIYRERNLPVADTFTIGLSEQVLQTQVVQDQGQYYILVFGRVEVNDESYYMIQASDVTAIYLLQLQMRQYFSQVYFLSLLVSLLVISVLVFVLFKPLKKMQQMTSRIALGSYNSRIPIRNMDEIGQLASDFNHMSEAVELKVEELKQNALQKEEFVASFAHELKTPLTSVIGYADMIHKRELNQKQVKQAAEYILQEGLRLESLSKKLLDLILYNRSSFTLKAYDLEEVITGIVREREPFLIEKQVSIHVDLKHTRFVMSGLYDVLDPTDTTNESDDACIDLVMLEFDLFKTLLLNLIENSIKAGATDIWIEDLMEQNLNSKRLITVLDNGSGIPPSELQYIKDAFYMVDKSRSRHNKNVGLGLALSERIACIHGEPLMIESVYGEYTMVTIALTMCDENNDITDRMELGRSS